MVYQLSSFVFRLLIPRRAHAAAHALGPRAAGRGRAQLLVYRPVAEVAAVAVLEMLQRRLELLLDF